MTWAKRSLGPGMFSTSKIVSVTGTNEATLNFPGSVAINNGSVVLQSVLLDGSRSWNDSVANTFAIWNEHMANFQVNWNFAPITTPAGDLDGVTSVQFNSQVYQQHFGSSTLAVALVNNDSNNRIIESDIIFNSAVRWQSATGNSGDPTRTDLHRVALHEVGHLLGLDHPDQDGQNVEAVMNAFVDGTFTLMLDDVAGAKALYGARAGAPQAAGDGRYTGAGRLANISTRGRVGTGESVMIGGFIVQGGGTKRVLIRVLGPSTGLNGVLENPVLELRNGAGGLIRSNDNWRDTQETEITNAGFAPSHDQESAMIVTVPANDSAYTAIVRGSNETTGIALVEVYDLDAGDPASPKLANISTRGFVGTGDDVLIGGLINFGPQPKGVIIRALGRSTGVAGALADPVLELRNGNGDLVRSNDDYLNDILTQQYGFAPTGTGEAALGGFLVPGNHTAIVRGKNNATGIALIEVYGVE